MTSSKTILYMVQGEFCFSCRLNVIHSRADEAEYFCGGCNVAHNDFLTLWGFWVPINCAWIVIPAIAVLQLTQGLTRQLSRGYNRGKRLQMQTAQHEVLDEKKAPRASTETPFVQPVGGAPLPLTFHPKGLNALVVGSNRLTASRVFTFLDAEAWVTVVSDKPSSELPEELQWRIQQGQIRFERFGGSSGAWQAFLIEKRASLVCVTDTLISTDNSDTALDVANTIASAARKLRIPINVADHPELSTYTFPSVHRFRGSDGPSNLQVAVSTNGQGCRLAGRIRREIAAKLPSSVGAAVDNIGSLRSAAKGSVSDEDESTPLNKPVPQKRAEVDDQLRRMRWVQQMSEYYSFDALANLKAEDMDAALEGDLQLEPLPHHEGGQGRIMLVGSGPGHPGLLTVAARHALENATLVLSDKLVPAEIIALIPKTTKLHIARKFPGNADGAQNELMELAIAGARAGETVVRLKQGDPFVYGRGGEEVLYFREHGYECAIIPGVSSALAGPLMTGIPVTQRGVADSLVLCTGVGRAGAAIQLPGYVKSRTLAILMGVARIDSLLEALLSPDHAGRDGAAFPPHLPVAIVERASSPDQRAILSTLENISDIIKSLDQRPPGMILVGWAAMCLDGKGRVDILDGADEREAVAGWLGGKKYLTKEGLPEEWKYFANV